MAEIDDKAFSFMQEASPDYVAGGALGFDSEYDKFLKGILSFKNKVRC